MKVTSKTIRNGYVGTFENTKDYTVYDLHLIDDDGAVQLANYGHKSVITFTDVDGNSLESHKFTSDNPKTATIAFLDGIYNGHLN